MCIWLNQRHVLCVQNSELTYICVWLGKRYTLYVQNSELAHLVE